MSVLISVSEVTKSYGGRTLFSGLSFSVDQGQRIGLIGPNGAGKSTLLKILNGTESADEGRVVRTNGLRLADVSQTPTFGPDETVFEALRSGMDDPSSADGLGIVQELASRLSLDQKLDDAVASLSGGWKKRVAIGRALAAEPDLLLMDEPTNHLDLPSILWLENELERRRSLALLVITHDRQFLQNTCDWIYDLDQAHPDGLFRFEGTYADFQEAKDVAMEGQKSRESARRNTLRRETEWLRRGAKARQTKQKARIQGAADLAEEVADLKERNRERRVDFDFGEGGRQPKKLIEAKGISKTYGERPLFANLDFILGTRARVGLLGENGCGKSTLIRVLLGREQPDTGTVRHAEALSPSYFEQMRDSLKAGVSLLRTLCPEGDYVLVRGQPVYAKSYLARFHFRPEQMDLPIERLSGGEQSRLLLAQLMLSSANLLVLDEPTNDLDIATLDTLRDAINEFPGAVIMVSHDRYFLDATTDQILAFDGTGGIERFADVRQWEEWHRQRPATAKKTSTETTGSTDKGTPQRNPSKKRLSYLEQREFDGIEEAIMEAEAVVSRLETALAAPDVSSDYSSLQTLGDDLRAAQQKVEVLYERWQELSEKIKN